MALAEIIAALVDTDLDSVLEGLTQRAIDSVQRELDWYFCAPRAAVETLDGTGTRELWIRQPPADGAVIVSTRSGIRSDWTTVSADDYELGGYGSILEGRGLFHASEWTKGLRNYRAEYLEGFTVMPGDVEQLIIDIVTTAWKDRSTNLGMNSEKIGDYAYTRGDLIASRYWGNVFANWHRGRI